VKSEHNAFYQLLGICQRAGKIVSGETLCEKAIRAGRVHLVIISHEASPNTSKKFVNMCKFRKIICITNGSKETLGKSIGKPSRTVIAVTDERFKNALLEQFHRIEN
jgi:ribosomal protein L7Ae-like RNA K-turn-binding protein